jgi:RNA polymerase sigma-54 factor
VEIALAVTQQQRLLLTPQLRQSMEILQMSSFDLNQYVLEQAADNPVIDFHMDKRKTKLSSRIANSRSSDWWLNDHHSPERTLEEVILEQIHYLLLDKMTLDLCKLIIGSLDERGYFLKQQQDWVAAYTRVSSEQVRTAIQVIQSLEPAGLAASSLEECLLIQLDHQNEDNPLLRNLITHDLPDIAKGKIQQLSKKYTVETSDIQKAIDLITKLNPKPGSMYSKEKPQYVIPDLILRQQDGQFELVIEEAAFPVLTLNVEYTNMMKQSESKEVSRYLKDRYQAATELMLSVEKRKTTLLRVASIIFEKQSEFGTRGPAYIQPLSMKQIADALQVHESTVSRTVNHKYVMTPWGLFELRHFFSSSIKQSEGDAVSAIHTKERIREIILHENKNAPLSDQKLAEILQGEGILISRRTVTKYREQLTILSTVQRKRY